MSAVPEQIPLDLRHRPALGKADFLIGPGNAAAVSQVLAWRDWPGRRMAVAGPPRSGKSHLAHVWMLESGAERIRAAAIEPEAAEDLARHGRVVVEDVDRIGRGGREAEQALFHLYNLMGAEGGWLMLTGRDGPARWRVRLPDLASRLAALPVARLDAPDDTVLSALLVKLFADRQLRVRAEVVRYLATRMERSFAEAERLVAALDQRSLATRRRVTLDLARAVLGPSDGDG